MVPTETRAGSLEMRLEISRADLLAASTAAPAGRPLLPLARRHPNLSRRRAFQDQRSDEDCHGSDLVSLIGEGREDGLGAVEDGDSPLALVLHPTDVSDCRGKRTIGGAANLVGGAVIHLQRRRSTPHVYPKVLPRKRLLEYALSGSAGAEA